MNIIVKKSTDVSAVYDHSDTVSFSVGATATGCFVLFVTTIFSYNFSANMYVPKIAIAVPNPGSIPRRLPACRIDGCLRHTWCSPENMFSDDQEPERFEMVPNFGRDR